MLVQRLPNIYRHFATVFAYHLHCLAARCLPTQTTSSDSLGRQRAANHMQMICKYGGKMAVDDVADVVLSAAVFFEICGTEVTDSDEDVKELCDTVIRRHR